MQANRVLLTTIKAHIKTLGRRTDADSFQDPSYIKRVAKEMVTKFKGKRNLSEEEQNSLRVLKEFTKKKK